MGEEIVVAMVATPWQQTIAPSGVAMVATGSYKPPCGNGTMATTPSSWPWQRK